MKNPTWVTFIGVTGMIFGGLGVWSGSQTVVMPHMLKMHQQMMSEMMKAMPRPPAGKAAGPQPEDMMKMFDRIYEVPDWFATWLVIAGLISVVVCSVYVFASISLLQLKPFALRLFYGATIASMTWTLVRASVAASAGGFLGYGIVASGMMGLAADIILLLVVTTSEKDVFYNQPVMIRDFTE